MNICIMSTGMDLLVEMINAAALFIGYCVLGCAFGFLLLVLLTEAIDGIRSYIAERRDMKSGGALKRLNFERNRRWSEDPLNASLREAEADLGIEWSYVDHRYHPIKKERG